MKNRLGMWGEEQALEYLTGKGYSFLQKNLRTPYGEIDLIVQKGEILVFVEVKTRSSRQFGDPTEAVNERKQERIRKSALWWVHERPIRYGEIRFDVIGIIGKKEKIIEIFHWQGGFE